MSKSKNKEADTDWFWALKEASDTNIDEKVMVIKAGTYPR